MNSNVTTALILDTRREKKDGTYPVKLRITYQRRRKYYGSKEFSFTKQDFEKVTGQKPRGDFKMKKLRLDAIEQKANKIIRDLPVFTFDKFEKKFLNLATTYIDLFLSFDVHISNLKHNGQVGTASTYETAKKSLQNYCYNKTSLKFTDITPEFLYGYEKWMLAEGRSITTVSMNTRCVRKLFNLAINEGDIRKEQYPFGRKEAGKYEIPEHKNIKKALHKSDLKKIFEYTPKDGSPEHYYRDIWLFSYLCNGANMADIFRLKYKNIKDENIVFIRHKTKHTRKLKPITAVLTRRVKDIITRWGNKPELPDKYVFNLLIDGLTPEKELGKIKQATKQVNKYIKHIATKVGIDESISTYTARHSYASVLKLSGEDVAYISESMGHSNIQTTEDYLSSFDEDKRRKAAKKLTDF